MNDLKKFSLYTVDDDYINYLRNNIDSNVCLNKSDSFKRPYVGFVLEINGYSYLVPLSSQIRKSNKITTVIPNTFTKAQKLEPDFETKYPKYIASIKFNNMIPVSNELIKQIEFSDLSESKEDEKYKDLLTKELNFCNDNKNNILNKAKKTYDMYLAKKSYDLAYITACCKFPDLENGLDTYLKSKLSIKEPVV